MQLVLSTPALYSLELTPACDNDCPGCFNIFANTKTAARRNTRAPLSSAQWRAILAKIQPYAERVKLTGGEPTLHPEFYDIVRTLADLNISFSIFTNARWRDPECLIERLKAVPQCVGLLVSLHGAEAASHETYTGVPGSFDETVASIRRAVNAGIKVATSTVITKQNCGQLKSVVALSASLGAGHAVINRYLGTLLPDIEPEELEFKTAVRTVEQMRQDGTPVKFGSCVPQCFSENSSTGCLAGVAYCAISPWGDLRPCNHSRTIAGNLLTQSVKEAWHSAGMAAWRALMPQECEAHCALFSACHGGCRALIEEPSRQRDPLRGAPLRVTPRQPAERLTLFEGLRPVGRYRLRQETFGHIALRGNCVIPISPDDLALLNKCDGSQTLREIQNMFGARGLRAIAHWHKKGLIGFAGEDAAPAPAEALRLGD